MDLLTDLLANEPTARAVITALLEPDGPAIAGMEFNVHEVAVDHSTGQLSVRDILDGRRPPFVVGFDEVRRRLASS